MSAELPYGGDRMLIYRLASALRRVLPYAESRAEDLDAARDAGQEDPAFPGAAEAADACEDATAILAAFTRKHLADDLSAPGVGDLLATALRNYAYAPGIDIQYGLTVVTAARNSVEAWASRSGEIDESDQSSLVRELGQRLYDFACRSDVVEGFGTINYDQALIALASFDCWTDCQRFAQRVTAGPALGPNQTLELSEHHADSPAP